jgi:hypothetical protein
MHNGGYHQCVVAEAMLDMTRYEREKVGLYKLKSGYPQRESAWFQPLSL